MKKTGTREWAAVNKNMCIGCSNDCRYCLDGDTLILKADGSTKPISTIRREERIIGIQNNRYVMTPVLDAWKSKKESYRITMENGVVIICSGNHGWLTTRGWKHTIGCMVGKNRRPYLTTNNHIRGFGGLIIAPKFTQSYMLGYVSGIIKGDGHLETYDYSGERRKTDVQYQFRLVMKDVVALNTVAEYLSAYQIKVHWFLFKNRGEDLPAFRTNKKEDVLKIKELIERRHNEEWDRGFLAGIFDAEGSYSCHNLRISNGDEEILTTIEEALETFNFKYVREHQKKKVPNIRIKGGIGEHVHFFNLVRPVISRKFRNGICGTMLKNNIKVKSIEPTGKVEELYDITTGTGNFIANGFVAHNCYAASNAVHYEKIPSREAWKDMELDEKLFSQSPRLEKKGRIMFPSQHDITPKYINSVIGYLRGWLDEGNEILIVSKPNLECIKKICDSLRKYKNQIVFRFTIGSMDDETLKFWDREAPLFEERFDSLIYAFEKGFQTSVSAEPYLDETIQQMVHKLLPYITDTIWIGKMNRIKQRVDWSGVSLKDQQKIQDKIFKLYRNDNVWKLYEEFKDEPKVRWKDSMKKVLNLPEEEIG